jgi:EAL domain-containing protein (putative c-di-GMP-specific phosphodiesterase class I)/GGDEF domain-containing protein
VVTPLTPGVAEGESEGPAALARFLTSLARSLGAQLVCFVPARPEEQPARSRAIVPLTDHAIQAIEVAARAWLADPHRGTERMAVGESAVDITEVRPLGGDQHGALLLVRSGPDRTDAVTAAAEAELAAALIPVVLATTPQAADYHALVEWAAMQRGGRTAFAVSLDRLATMNEVLGQQVGDAILQRVAERVDEWAGGRGRMARSDGARFLVVRADVVDDATATQEANRLRTLIAAPLDVDGLAVSRSASVGVATDPTATVSTETLVRRALHTNALVRHGGGDSMQLYDDAAASGRLTRLQLELELHGALANGQLLMHYQPEFDLRTGRIRAVEALLRWQHPDRGLLGADHFVPDSEQTHTFAAIQQWVIDVTCGQLAAWQAAGIADDLVMRVNVAAPQVPGRRVTAALAAALDRYGLHGSQLCVELTERRMPARSGLLSAELDVWRELGITVAIDDFGTGEGTLTHLLDLPIDIVKLDQSFVAAMTDNARAGAIVQSVLSLCRALELDVVAEGIATPEAVATLLDLGCERGQGNFLAEAMPADQVEAALRAQHR